MKIFTLRYLLVFTVSIAVLYGCKNDNPKPAAPLPVRDIDGNTYKTVTIGNNTWLAENLKVTHYRNGDAILASSTNLDTGAYCNYNNDPAIGDIYGRLYNNAVIHDSRNVCPAGWHLPTDVEWHDLAAALGGDNAAGGPLKEAGNAHWLGSNVGATDSSGFNGLPAGNDGSGTFVDIGRATYFWSNPGEPYTRALDTNNAELLGTSNTYHNQFLSIRCVKDK
ncbi:MAG TPA: fibrobacter succinogenes major paralogous domain-containing protein [Mucilaginibacter sp.]